MPPVDDISTVSLLHFDGLSDSTIFTDESGKIWTARNHAKLSALQAKFSGSSGLFDGVDDYIDTPDSLDWQLDGGSNANAWTIDWWDFLTSTGNYQGQCIQYVDDSNYWGIHTHYAGGIYFKIRSGGSDLVSIGDGRSSFLSGWNHHALVKNGVSGYAWFTNGIKTAGWTTNTAVFPNFSATLAIGRAQQSGFWYFPGYIDEFRISKGVARWTDNFTLPSVPYGPANNGNSVILFSEIGGII